jgi:hypothetical protein
VKQGKSKNPPGVVTHKVVLAYILLFFSVLIKITGENDCEGKRCDKGEKFHYKCEQGSGER